MRLLERDAALRDLRLFASQAAAGAGRFVLVSGEGGIGKSTLIEQWVSERPEGLRVLWGQCDALYTPRPLGPLHDMAAQAMADRPADLPFEAGRSQLFGAFLADLQARPSIVVFEDVHWADEATLDLLTFMGRRISRAPVVVVMTYRDDALGLRHPLRALLGDLATSPATRRIMVQPLSMAAVQAMAGERAIDGARLHNQTAGNPFFVSEVLASGAPEGQLPPTVRDAVLARVARLSVSAQAVLQMAAVIGMRVEPWLLARVAGAEANAADECLATGVLVAHGDYLAFRHELARRVIIESVPPYQRAAMHRMILDALRESPAAQRDLARLAHHSEGTGDGDAVLEFAPPAAAQASAAGAHREAMALYALAVRFADGLPPAEQAALLDSYAVECNLTERQAEGIAARRKALDIWRDLQNLPKQGRELAILAILLRNHGDYCEAEQASHAAIDLLEPLPPGPELALAYRCQATLRLATRDNQQAIAFGERAIAMAEPFGDQNVLGMAHVAVGAAKMLVNYDQGRAYLERRLELARESGNNMHIANLLLYMGSCSCEAHQFKQAERYLAAGVAHTAEAGLDMFHRFTVAWLAIACVHLGRWESAAEMAGQWLRSRDVVGNSRVPALVALGRLRTRRGDPGVHAALDEAATLAANTGSLPHLGMAHAARAEAACLAGDHQRTLDEVQNACDLAVSKQHPWFTGELVYWRWRAGQDPAAPDWIARPYALQISGRWSEAARAWEQMGCPYEQARALAEGDTPAQAAALAIFERLGARPAAEAVRSSLQAAGARLPRGPRAATRANVFGLTPRQLEVLRLIAQDLTNAEIAARLHLSPKTVDHHVAAVLAKMNVHTRQAAAALARQTSGLLTK